MESVELRVSVNREELTKLEADVAKLKNTDVKISVDASGMKALDKETLKTLNSVTKYVKAVSGAERAEAQLSAEQRKTAKAQEATAKAAQKQSQSLDKVSSSAKNTSRDMGQVSDSTQKAQKSMDKANDSYTKFAEAVSKRVITAAVNGLKSALNDALDTMKAVDDQLVTVRKVTQASASEMAVIEEQAYKTAAAYGTEADAYLESVAAFARAGYKDRSAELAELSTKTQIVGDTTAEVANQMLLSVDAAYKYGGSVKELERVLDGMNEIDNNFATSIEKISEGLGKVAPIASQAHVGVNELSAALGTITAVTQRSGTEAATALRALMLNIIGDTKTEVEDGVTWTIGEIEGLRDVIKKYSREAYEAAQATGQVINPMEAIAGLSKSMKSGDLTEQKLVDMVSDIGGKLRTTQLLALIQNWDTYEKMLASFGDSVGSADKEVENALDSWTRKTAILSDKWAQLVSHLIQTDTIKSGIDLVSGGLDLLDTNMGRAATSGLALASAGTAIVAVVKGLKATEAGSAILGVIGNPYFLGAAAVITAIAAAIGAAKDAMEEAQKPISDYALEIESATEQLEENQARLEEINKIPWSARSAEIDAERAALMDENEELRKNLELLEKKAIKNAKNKVEGTVYTVREDPENFVSMNYTPPEQVDTDMLNLAESIRLLQMGEGRKTVEELMKVFPQLGDTAADATAKLTELGYSIETLEVETQVSGDTAIGYFTEKIKGLRDTFLSDGISYEEYADGLNAIYESTGDLIPSLEYLATTEEGVTEKQQEFMDAVDGADATLERFTPVVRGAGEAVNTFAEPWDSATFSIRQTTEAVKEAQGETDALSAILFDAEGNLTEFAEKALEAAGYTKDLAYQETQANYAATKANYENIIAQIQAVGSAAMLTASQLQLMAASMGVDDAKMAAWEEVERASNGRTTVADQMANYAKHKQEKARQEYEKRIKELMGGAPIVTESKDSGGGSGGSKSYTRRDTLESELKLLEAQGASAEEQAAKMREIQDAISDEADQLRSVGASEVEINNLSAEWWDYQNKINDALGQTVDLSQDAADAEREREETLKKQLEIEEKQLAVEKARDALENAKKQRSVRIYNAATGQWERVADQRVVDKAQENLDAAEKALAEARGDDTSGTGITGRSGRSGKSGTSGSSSRGSFEGIDFTDPEILALAKQMGMQELAQDPSNGKWYFNGFEVPTTEDLIQKVVSLDKQISDAKETGQTARASALSARRSSLYHAVFDNYGEEGSPYTGGKNSEVYKNGQLLTQNVWDDANYTNGLKTRTLSVENILRKSNVFADEITALQNQGWTPSSIDASGNIRSYMVWGRSGTDSKGATRFYDPDQDYVSLMQNAKNEKEFWQYSGLNEAKVNDYGGTIFSEDELNAMLDVAKLRWDQEKKQAEINDKEILQLKNQYAILVNQNATLDEKLAKLDEINDAYDQQKKYLEGIGAAEEEINDLEKERSEFNADKGWQRDTDTSVTYEADVDYSKLMMQATTKEEFDDLAAKRAAKAAAQGIDISGTANGGYRSNEEIAAQAGFYDAGGILGGIGGIKATMRDEMVLPPDITARMLAPSADSRFQTRMSELRYLYGDRMQGVGSYSRYDNRIGAQYNGEVVNGGKYNLGGITLNEQQAKTTTVYDLARLARNLKTQSSLT